MINNVNQGQRFVALYDPGQEHAQLIVSQVVHTHSTGVRHLARQEEEANGILESLLAQQGKGILRCRQTPALLGKVLREKIGEFVVLLGGPEQRGDYLWFVERCVEDEALEGILSALKILNTRISFCTRKAVRSNYLIPRHFLQQLLTELDIS